MKRSLSLLLGLSLGASAAFAQSANTSIIDRAQQPAPPVAPRSQTDTAIPTGIEGEDAGVQRVAEPRKFPIKLFLDADTQVYYTDNVLLQPANNPQSNSDAVVFATTLSVRAETPSKPFANGLITPSIGLVYQRYYHGIASDDPARDDLDFDSYSIPLTLRFRNQSGWDASVGVTAGSIYRLNGASSYENIYRNLTPSVSVRKSIGLSKTQLVSLGTTLSYAKTWADTPGGLFSFRDDRNDKVDLSGDIAYYYIRGRWVLNAYGRAAFTDYLHYQEAGNRDVNRRDTTLSLGASATYNLTSWASARVFTSSDWRLSNQEGNAPTFDNYTYESSNLGIGLSLSANF
ncbi:MAG: hypothetical protein ACAH89_06990 [Rariglobus sp.]